MDYPSLKQTAINLLREFGNSKNCVLLKRENGEVKKYNGVGVKLRYDAQAIDGNIIKMGDAKILCYFDVEPTEMVDIIQIENDSFSILHAGDTSPDNVTKLLYTLHVRQQGKE